jgi:muramidase (phage lysozyme)
MAGLPSWFKAALGSEPTSAPSEAPKWFQSSLSRSSQLEGVDGGAKEATSAAFEDQLLARIGEKEAPNHGYSDYFGRGTGRAPTERPKDLTGMTVDEVLEWQVASLDGAESSAAGKYQIINKTLKSLKRKLGLTGTELFNEGMQDKLGIALLERRGLNDFKRGTISAEEFGTRLAKEWASFPVLMETKRGDTPIKVGQSYYRGVGSNRSLFKETELKEYSTFLASGIENSQEEN